MQPSQRKKMVIWGTGEIGRLAKYYFDHDSEYEVVGFTADDEFVIDEKCDGLPVVPLSKVKDEFPPNKFVMHVALSYKKLNQVRAQKYNQAKALGYSLASYVCSKSVFWSDLSIGDNCFILENQTIQPTVKIGNNVMVWSGNHIGHGTSIGDHTYISSHVCISGHVQIGTHCFLGVNSAIKDFNKIGNSVFIGMGSVVTCDIGDGGMVVNAKSEIYPADSKVTTVLKRKYFNC